MPRFRQLNAGPRIARKSDGMIQYANMVIENLKQSKAVRINVQLLMKRLPDGMSDLYKQILERLQEDDREMLLTVLRWLMCSEGKIEIALVLDEHEWTPHHFACWKNGGNIGIELLAQHDADVNALERIKQTLLSVLAAGSGSPKLFQYLLHLGAKPEVPNRDGRTCLHYAAHTRNLELCSVLVRCTTVGINAEDSEGETPLHWMFKLPNASYDW